MTAISRFISCATSTGRARMLSPHEALLLPSLQQIVPRTESLPHQHVFAGQHIYSFRPAGELEHTLAQVVSNFSRDIRARHRTKVHWPDDTTYQSSAERLISPVLHLLSQLRAPVIKHPLQSVSTELDDGALCMVIQSVYPPILDAPPVTAKTPVLILLPPKTFGNHQEAASKLPQLSGLFRNAWSGNNGSKIICTDLSSLFILQLSTAESDVVIQEHLLLDKGLVAARVVLAAYIYEALPEDAYLTFPCSTKAYDPPVVFGCLPNPSIPMLSDEEVFRMCNSHRDFDLYTLMNVPPLALQFLRWKVHMRECAALIQTIHPGDILFASTGGFAKENALLTPYWPVDVDSIPLDTMECIRAVARPHALDETSYVRLGASKTFRLKVLEQLAATREPRGASVYRCEIVSIDDEMVLPGSSNLCVKLFDDRLLVMDPPEEPDEASVGPDEGWWWGWSTNEQCIRNEHAAYQQLSFAQGSLVPWYYGAHKFVQANGHSLYGILLEFIPDAKTMDDVPAMSEEACIQLIHNARHLLRAMQYADVSQHDFHHKQLMVLPLPVLHAVMLDFASASTSTEPELHENHDYLQMLMVLENKIGKQNLTILTHFGEREVWDRTTNTSPDGKGGWHLVSAPDPFAWVYDGQE